MAVLFYLLCALPLAFAQYGGGSASTTSSAAASTTSSGASSVQTITVGQSGLKFSPESVVVAPGKSVVFQFYPGNHSVIQSAFDTPCAPANASAFFSGFVDSSSGPATQVFTLSVNSTDPIWFYCGQITHCQAGMVGVINPPASGQTLDQFRSAAAGTKSSTAPAQVQGGTVAAPSSSSSGATPSSTKSAGDKDMNLTSGWLWALLVGLVTLGL